MSYRVFFELSTGLRQPLHCPAGTLAAIRAHVAEVEAALDLRRVQRDGQADYWETRGFPSDDLEDELLCKVVEDHNRWVRWLYDRFAVWSKEPVEGGDVITPEEAATFWHGLRRLFVLPDRWTGDYYRARMEVLYEVMRGRPTEGISFDAPKLSPKQAGAVIRLFSEHLDPQDLRLEVPRGCDHLASSYWGEYEWCERCAAVLPEDAAACRKRGCPVQAAWCEEDRPEWFREAVK